MLQQINTRRSSEGSLRSESSFNVFTNIDLDRISQFLRYIGIAVLSIAYFIVTAVCLLEDHPMSSFLMMPMVIVLLVLAISVLSKIKNNNKN
ncbi:hypothetical protein F0365_08305 [Nonlabens sp. Ci31]|jgi:hypothetical protein|uniref:hypothetical protein n=1 Tax=Nonlabens sp. Ci31 TaxID=2608253 RepID=UPI00146447D3|nr:hypothetical protein [Nonlabens sp. Ci31]QJP34399.1 hypothetical protein F0365_08305 [Nonlabens sp. Ci31]